MTTLYAADMNNKRLHAVDYESGEILRTIELEQDPWGIAFAQNGEHLAVALDTIGTLVVHPETFEKQSEDITLCLSMLTVSSTA